MSKTSVDLKKIIDLRDEGLTYAEISEKVKCSRQYAYQIIKKRNDYEELQRYRALDAAYKVKAKNEFKEKLKEINISQNDVDAQVLEMSRSPRGAKTAPGRIPGLRKDRSKNTQQTPGATAEYVEEKIKEEKSKFAYNSQKEYGSPETITVDGIEAVKPGAFLTNRLEMMHMLPPGGGSPITYPWQNYAGVFRAGQDFYLPADLAVQQSRENARNMWNDLVCREPLQARLWASAEQEWHIEPKDRKDPVQVYIAKCIQETIENIPDFLKLRYSLLKSRWYGVYGAQLVYQWGPDKKLNVKKWNELNGDSLVFKMSTEEVGVYVSSTGYKDARQVSTEAGYIGRVHVYEDGTVLKFDDQGRPYYPIGTNERDAIIIARYDPQAADFLDSRNAGGIVGLGIRSTIYPSWWLMKEITGNMVDFVERFATGMTMYKFLRGNESSYNAAVQLAESQSNQSVVMVPVDVESGGKMLEGVERLEVGGQGLDNMLKVVQDFFGAQIRRFIVGQDSTSQPVQTGLGSKIASVQESTFGRIVSFDCADLAETLTHQLVRVIQKWNHPGTEHCPCKFVIDYAKPNIDAQITAAKTLFDMGVEFDADELRSLTGLSKPQEGAVILKKSEDKAMNPFGNMPPQLEKGEEKETEEAEEGDGEVPPQFEGKNEEEKDK